MEIEERLLRLDYQKEKPEKEERQVALEDRVEAAILAAVKTATESSEDRLDAMAAVAVAFSHAILWYASNEVPQEGFSRLAFVHGVIEHTEAHVRRGLRKQMEEEPETAAAVLEVILGAPRSRVKGDAN